MAQDQKPMTDDELEQFEAAMDEQREDIRKALAEDLGGEPEDYDVEARLNDRAGDPVADGGE